MEDDLKAVSVRLFARELVPPDPRSGACGKSAQVQGRIDVDRAGAKCKRFPRLKTMSKLSART